MRAARLRLFLAFSFPHSLHLQFPLCLFCPKRHPLVFSFGLFLPSFSPSSFFSPSPCVWFSLSDSFFSHTYPLLGVTLLAVCERGSSQGCKHILWEISFQLCVCVCVCVCMHATVVLSLSLSLFVGRWGVFSPALGTDSQVLEKALQWAWRMLLMFLCAAWL